MKRKDTGMKIAHWVLFNNSGMYHLAEDIVKHESMSGLNSWLVNYQSPKDYVDVLDADIHVIHTHLPDDARLKLKKNHRIVWVAHGTPEYVFQRSVEAGLHDGYGASDSWMLCQYWMQHADAIVSFWERQAAIWKQLCDKHTIVDCIPQGVDKNFWKPVESAGKYLGKPSLFSAENSDYSKWALDLIIAWGWAWEKIPEAFLHLIYLPNDQHRWFYPLLNRNGAGFKTISSGYIFDSTALRNAFVSTDYFIGLVRYGTENLLFRQASASGAKTITYAGNKFADFWIPEGDQRTIADTLVDILKGNVEPRKHEEVPDISETTESLKKIYERIL
jgi:hypothetical protein